MADGDDGRMEEGLRLLVRLREVDIKAKVVLEERAEILERIDRLDAVLVLMAKMRPQAVEPGNWASGPKSSGGYYYEP